MLAVADRDFRLFSEFASVRISGTSEVVQDAEDECDPNLRRKSEARHGRSRDQPQAAGSLRTPE
jgi:hypothetical protein